VSLRWTDVDRTCRPSHPPLPGVLTRLGQRAGMSPERCSTASPTMQGSLGSQPSRPGCCPGRSSPGGADASVARSRAQASHLRCRRRTAVTARRIAGFVSHSSQSSRPGTRFAPGAVYRFSPGSRSTSITMTTTALVYLGPSHTFAATEVALEGAPGAGRGAGDECRASVWECHPSQTVLPYALGEVVANAYK